MPLDVILCFSLMVILGITVRGLCTMCFGRKTWGRSKLVITQRRRYGWTLVGQLAAAAAVLWPLLQYGVDDTFRVLDVWPDVPPIGWIVAGVYAAGILSPVLTLLTMMSIHRHPAQAAKRVDGGYVLTKHQRQKLSPPPVVKPVVASNASRRIVRYKFNVDSSNVSYTPGQGPR